ncbi:hypothetical protein SDC9_160976 [bioreactor metagenome]|uniref:Uncharacterized protein n=1 Tax=bioreactor metagenome TaxID=1076179 RepID=A0A645FN79_9ZZZZ
MLKFSVNVYGLMDPLPKDPYDTLNLMFEITSGLTCQKASSDNRQPAENEGKNAHCWLLGNLDEPS